MDYHQDKDDYNGEDVRENNILNHSSTSAPAVTAASVLVKTEAPPDNVLDKSKLPTVKEEQRPYEDPHVDHSYINDSSPLKFDQTKLPHSSSTLQEVKLRPQFIKEEASVEQGEVHIKTETNSLAKATKFKCSTCNLPFRNKYILKTHRDVCHARNSHTPFANNLIKQINLKYRSQNAMILRRLIDCVKNNPCLYDVDHENFNNVDLKSAIWSNIASECSFANGSIASSEWKTLKNQFIKAITQRSLPNASKRSGSKWPYEKLMEFTMPFITDDEVHMNIRKETTNTDSTMNVEEQTIATEEAIEEDGNYSNDVQQHTPLLKRMSVSSTQQENYSKRKRGDERPSTSQSQPLDMFFLSMCATTKNLPEYVQLQVKKKIFQAVIEAEEIVAAMHNDQEKNNLMNNEYDNNMSPFSVHSNVNEVWEND